MKYEMEDARLLYFEVGIIWVINIDRL